MKRMFLVTLNRSGPEYRRWFPLERQSGWPAHALFMDRLVEDGFVVLGGLLGDGHGVALAVESESEDEIRATLAGDPWSGSHLEIDSIEPWIIRLDVRRLHQTGLANSPA
jgi:hypothetical protein